MRNHRVLRVAAVAVTLAATAPAVAAAASSQDLRSPDARDAAAVNGTPASPGADLRSPDARDTAGGRATADAPAVLVVPRPSAATGADGMDWADAGIGAGGAIVLVAAALGGGVSLSRRRHGVALGRRVGSVG